MALPSERPSGRWKLLRASASRLPSIGASAVTTRARKPRRSASRTSVFTVPRFLQSRSSGQLARVFWSSNVRDERLGCAWQRKRALRGSGHMLERAFVQQAIGKHPGWQAAVDHRHPSMGIVLASEETCSAISRT